MTATDDKSTLDSTADDQDFLAVLTQLAKGRTVRELGTKLTELIGAIRDTGKGGSLQLTLTIKPATKTNDDALTVADRIVVKAPVADRKDSFFFIDGRNHLVRDNPTQRDLFQD